jgi:hypothetical protein
VDQRTVNEIAESLGLSVETLFIADHENAMRVYKGAKQVFVGTEEAVRNFLSTYEDQRPAPYVGSMYNYKE